MIYQFLMEDIYLFSSMTVGLLSFTASHIQVRDVMRFRAPHLIFSINQE